MRNPKVGDMLVISEYYDENEERIIDSGKDRPRMAVVSKVIRGAVFADDILNDYSYQILIGFPDSLDKWGMVVEEGDERHFSEETNPVGPEPVEDICDSYNDVVAKDDVEPEYVPQSFSDFNATSGGGKTLKDYTGVGFTKEELAFKSSHEKALESLTAGSLAFSPLESDIVNHPSHYNYGDIEVIDMLEALSSGYSNSTDAYLISTAAKYLYRADHKGKKVEDWKKAVWYIERAIEREEAHNE